MTLQVTHSFVSTLADDPGAAGVGEVLPSEWNANHTVVGTVDPSIGARTKLTANTSYFVSATGSDSHGGTNSTTDAWLTLQHAAFYIAENIDVNGFVVVVNIGAGTFAGFGMPSTVGGGYIRFSGAGTGSTTITGGPNDGLYNFGECVTFAFPLDTFVTVDKVTIKVPAGNAGIAAYLGIPNIGFGDQIGFTTSIAFDLSASNSGSNLIVAGAPVNFAIPSGTITINAGTANHAIQCNFNAFYQNFATWTLTGTPTFAGSFLLSQNSRILDKGSYSGAATGIRFKSLNGSAVGASATGALGASFYPGNSAGTCDASSSYDGYPFVQLIAGDPTTTNIADSGAWEMVENTNLGIPAPWWNSAGTLHLIGRYRLTADTNFYVSATGSDSHGGTNSSTDAWLTIQHGINYIVSNFDLSNFKAIINVGAGSFAGFTLGGSTNGGSIYVIGAGSASTTITSGAGNALLYNGADAYFGIDAVTFDVNNAGSNGAIFINAAIIGGFQIGNINFNNVDVKFTNSGASSTANCITIGAGGGLLQPVPGGAMTIAANFNAVIFMSAPGAFLLNNTTITVTGSPTWGQAFIVIVGPGLYQEAGSVTGAASGTRFILTDGGGAFGGSPTQGALGPNHFSGSVAGTADGDSNYDGFVGPLPGIDTQTGASYTLALSDFAGIVEMNNGGANTLTVPTNASVAFPIGTRIKVVQIGAGATTIAAAGGVTVNNAGVVGGQWKSAFLYKSAINTWTQTT